MSAQSLQALTVVFADHDLLTSSNGLATSGLQETYNGSLTRVTNLTIAYNYITDPLVIRTLSVNHAPAGADITGLLYVPDLLPNDPCTNVSSRYVPKNVTRQSDLPATNFNVVALAPWISANCTQSYLAAARNNLATKGFLFYLAGDNSQTIPPEPVSEVWNLQDGGDWRKENHWPVYALPGGVGQMLMQASNQYSGNMSEVPSGKALEGLYNSSDYVRLYVDIDTAGAGGTLPSIWLFLLVVLGILLSVMGFTSLLMHYIQRRRRQLLRRRVANGEIDLETLGIKRLTVPQETLDEMPLYIYGTGAPVPAAKAKPRETSPTVPPPIEKISSSAKSSRPNPPILLTSTARATPALARSTSYHPSPLQQPTCAICLDDFIPAAPNPQTQETPPSTIRELPCLHIFHPECVDAFLLNNSSLCPMCKKSALPAGYCPRVITNAMVRRERMIRRIQERTVTMLSFEQAGQSRMGNDDPFLGDALDTRLPGLYGPRAFSGAGLTWLGGSNRGGRGNGGRRTSSAPVPLTNIQPMTELPPTQPSQTDGFEASQAVPPPPPASSRRREWARQRAVALLGRGAAAPPPVDDPDEVESEAPRWRRTLRGVFPAAGLSGAGVGRPSSATAEQ